MLQVSHVSIAFHQYTGRLFARQHVTALSDISVTMEPGEILVVVGESGAGKSLLADAVLDLLPANAHTTGTVLLDGASPTPQRGTTLRYLPQGTAHIDPQMTIGEFVGISVPDPAAALGRFGLGPEVLGAYPHELSGGMLRRVSLATTVGHGCRLLVADEPTPGLHPEAVGEVLDYFRELREAGTGVLFITHDLVNAATIADRIMVLRQGTVDQIVRDPSEFTGYGALLWAAQPANDFWEAL